MNPDLNIWVPALRAFESEDDDLALEAWATKNAASPWAEGVTPDPAAYERIRGLLMVVGDQYFPGCAWDDKWIHCPDRDDTPLVVMIDETYDVKDDGSDNELRGYLRVGDPLLTEEPIVEEVDTAMGRGLRAIAYSRLHQQGEVKNRASLAYVWRVESPDPDDSPDDHAVTILRLFTMDEDPARILRADDDIHALAKTLRRREE